MKKILSEKDVIKIIEEKLPELIIISPHIREEGKRECEFWRIKYYEKE